MILEETNPPAFPLCIPISSDTPNIYTHGMSLRDYVATHAMQSLLMTPESADFGVNHIAPLAYQLADAMLKARGE